MEDFYNLSLEADRIDALLLFLNENETDILLQSNIKGTTGSSTTDTMGQKAITDALDLKADKSTTYTKTETDKLIAPLATQEDVEAVEQEVAQIAGEAGLAEAVIDTDNAGTEQEFTFRKSGGDGGAYYRKIKGKTIVVDSQLASNDAEAVETTGANQWDEEWEVGSLNVTTGEEDGNDNYTRCKNFIPVIGGSTYYFLTPNVAFYVLKYDSNKNYLGWDIFNNASLALDANVAYIKIVWLNMAYGKYYKNDICINLSNPAINGQYFPYWKRTLQLGITTKEDTDGNVPFADGMKGAGTAADWADKVGGEVVMDKVDLSELHFSAIGDSGHLLYTTELQNVIKGPSSDAVLANAICSSFTINILQSFGTLGKVGEFAIGSNGVLYLYVADNTQTDVTGELVYQRATPVPFTWKEPLNLGVKVDENGTERAVQPAGATNPSAPFVADTTYTMSVARMVEILKNL